LRFSIIAAQAQAEQQTVVLTPSNWKDVFDKINAGYIVVSLTTGVGMPPLVSNTGQMLNYVVFIFANGTVTVTPAGSSQGFTLPRGIYIATAYQDNAGRRHYYIYTISGLVAQGQFPGTDTVLYFDKRVYAGTMFYDATTLFDTIARILYDWQGRNGGRTAWILFNVTGNMPVSYTVREGASTRTLSYGGGPPIYMLYVGRTLPINVTTVGFSRPFGAGAYLIVGTNWFKVNYSETVPSQPSQNQTATAKLTVTVQPSTYTIQFLLQGALVAQSNGTLTYTFSQTRL